MMQFDPRTNDLDLSHVAWESMSPEQRLALVRSAGRLAHAHRARAIHALLRRRRRWLPDAAAAVPKACLHWAVRLAATLARGWQAYVDRRRRLRSTAALEALSDHMLKDLGLSRTEIPSAVLHGRYRPPARQATSNPDTVRNLTPAIAQEHQAAKRRATSAAVAATEDRKAA